MRLFLGIPVPDSVKAQLEQLLEKLQHSFAISSAAIKWANLKQMHITLKFFGEVDEQSTGAIAGFMRTIARQQPAFDACLAGLGGFPDLGAPRVLWVGLSRGTESISGLAKQIEGQAQAAGFKPESRAFHAHVTLARIESAPLSRKVGALAKQAPWKGSGCWRAESINLYQSRLSSAGAAHEVLTAFSLEG